MPEDKVLAIRIHDEWHNVGDPDIDGSTALLEEEIPTPEQCDSCGSTMTEEEALEVYHTPYGSWPLRLLRLSDHCEYQCTRPTCQVVYPVRKMAADLVVF